MPSKHNLNVSIAENLAGIVAAHVASGGLISASQVVQAGFRLLKRELTAAPEPAPTNRAADGPAVPSGLAQPSDLKGWAP